MVGDPRFGAVVCTDNGKVMGYMVGDPLVRSRLAVVCANNGVAMG